MSDMQFDDLLLIRKGGPRLTAGAGPSTVEIINTPGDWATKAKALREILDQAVGETPAIECPPEIEVEREDDCGQYTERRISYFVEPDERVASLALVPKDQSGPLPAVLCIHPTQAIGKEETVGREPTADQPGDAACAYGLHLVRRGYVTFAPDLLGAGERIFPGCEHFDNQPLFQKHPRWSGVGKDLWDMRRALDVLQSMREVAPDRMGAIGHSQGACTTTYLAAIDERVKVSVSNCGLWPIRCQKNPFRMARSEWWTGLPALRPFFSAAKTPPIDLHELLALSTPRAFLNISALNDWGYSVEDESFARPMWENLVRNVETVYSLLSAAGRFRSEVHMRGHVFPRDIRETAYAFLDEFLR